VHTQIDDGLRLEAERLLRRRVRGDVRFDRLHRTLYSTDASLYEIVPAGVVLPRDTDDVVAAVEVCGRLGVPIVARGAGTGIAGGAVGWGVQLDFSRYMTRIGAYDAATHTVEVEPGVVLDDLNAALAPHGRHFPADVAPSNRATLGGMIANNSCGSHSVYYGRTVDWVAELTVVLGDGSVARWPQLPWEELPPTRRAGRSEAAQRPILPRSAAEETPAELAEPASAREREIRRVLARVRAASRADVLERYPRVLRRNGGYALDRLCMSSGLNPATIVCGSEGTLALVVGATLRLAPTPAARGLVVICFDDVLDAVGAAPALLAHRPSAVELVDERILAAGAPEIPAGARARFMQRVPRALLACELYDDDEASLAARLRGVAEEAEGLRGAREVNVVADLPTQAAVWNMRNRGFGLLMSRPGDRQPYEFIEDAAVDPSRLRAYIADIDALLRAEGIDGVAYYAHASVGVIHVRPVLNLKQRDDVARLRRIAERVCDLVARYGGAMTGEHGDGLVRSEWHERMYGTRIVAAFGEIKRAFDPAGLLNPGKIVAPLPMDQRIRYGADYRRLPVRTRMDFGPHGGPAELAGMCSGVGQCRQKLTGTMCPSYMATLDELHTTRGRANALRAALSNRGLLSGLDDPALDEAMDLCLQCKACKSECPTGVDMAKLKAEWLYHRNATRGAGRGARFLAAAPLLARLGGTMPAISNYFLQRPWVRGLLETWFGVDRRIAPPAFARESFRAWFDRRGGGAAPDGRRGRVVYFADTWTNGYWPQAGRAAVALLEAAGYAVLAPALGCCGRPLISKGLLDEAARGARENVAALHALLDGSTWIAASEPSCLSALIDEYPALLRSAAARQVAERARSVEALLVAAAEGGAMPAASSAAGGRRVLLHGHCHQKALWGTSDALHFLRSVAGVDAREINSGCCGMAGSFGHETAHYDVARAVGEQRLFPAVRARGDAEVAVCGFSCREQIAHHAGVTPRHALEIAAEALGLPTA